MRLATITWILVLLASLVPVSSNRVYVSASGESTLIYLRALSETQTEYVRSTPSGSFRYTLPPSPICWRFSPNGQFIAFASLEPEYLVIVRSDTLETVLSIEWQNSWRPCSILWQRNTIIGIASSDNPNQGFNYEIANGVFTPIAELPPSVSVIPQLPELYLLSSRREWVLPSVQPNIFLYQRCFGQAVPATPGWAQACPGGLEGVVYDASLNTIISTLNRTSPLLSGVDLTTERLLDAAGAAWSFDGRYLAYRYIPESLYQTFDLAILDIASNSYLPLNSLNEEIEHDFSPTWSPLGYKLVFWIGGLYGEDQENSNAGYVSPTIYDVTQQRFVGALDTFELPANTLGNPITWSPDGEALVFIDSSNRLIRLDTNTGVSTLVDTQVSRVIAWNEVEIVIPTATPTLVPTNTPTPTATFTPTITPSPTVTPTSTPLPTSSLNSFVVLGQSGVWLEQNSTVVSGNIGANTVSSAPFLSEGSEVTIGIGVDLLDPASRVLGDTVTVKQGAEIYDVYFNELGGLGDILGQQFTPITLPLVQAFPTVPTFTPGTQNFDVAQNGSLTLVAGSYGLLKARNGAVITLSGGVYNFQEWDIGMDVTVNFAAPSEIRVAGKLKVEQDSYVGPAPASGLDAADIMIYVMGQNGNNGNLGATPKAAHFGINNTLIANVYVPNGTLWIRQGSTARGAFIGRWVDIGIGVEVTLESGF